LKKCNIIHKNLLKKGVLVHVFSFLLVFVNGMSRRGRKGNILKYKINLGRPKKGEFLVTLDDTCPIAIPKIVTIGVGKRKERYTTWLEASIENEDNNPDKDYRLKFLAFIHKLGLDNGYLFIDSTHFLREMQLECVKEFLVRNEEFLDQILPYIFETPIEVSGVEAIVP